MLAKSLVYQADVSVIFFHRDSSPHLWGIDERSFRILNKAGNFEQTLNDMAIARLNRRVLQDKRTEQRVTNKLNVHGGVVAEALNLTQLQHGQIDLVLDDLIVGAFFGRERFRFDEREPVTKIGIES